jgi:hypothetical protein
VCVSPLDPQGFPQGFGLLQVGGVKSLSEPAVDLGQALMGIDALALLLPQAGEARGCTQLPGFGLLASGNGEGAPLLQLLGVASHSCSGASSIQGGRRRDRGPFTYGQAITSRREAVLDEALIERANQDAAVEGYPFIAQWQAVLSASAPSWVQQVQQSEPPLQPVKDDSHAP